MNQQEQKKLFQESLKQVSKKYRYEISESQSKKIEDLFVDYNSVEYAFLKICLGTLEDTLAHCENLRLQKLQNAC